MRADDLLDIIGETADEHIRNAKPKRNRMPRWAKWSSAIAACLCLVVGGVYFLDRMGGAGQGSGGDSDLNYMYYPGPVLPLTIQGEAEGITAQRNVNFDFSPYITRIESYEDNTGVHTYEDYSAQSIITDTYTLTNESQSDQTLTLLYPFTGDLRGWEQYPAVTVDGAEVETVMNPGPYSGGFEGVWGAKNQENGTANLKENRSFDRYEALLADGSYMDSAFDAFPELDQPVTVYQLHDYVYSAVTEDVNPCLNMEFYVDPEETYVLSYNMNGMSYDEDTGYHSRRISGIEYRPNAKVHRQHPHDAYVILVGEDLESYTLQGYRDLGCDPGEELDDLKCTVTRFETTLGEIVRTLLEVQQGEDILALESTAGTVDTSNMPSMDLYYGLTAELLLSYGPLGKTPVEHYDNMMLESIFSGAFTNGRVIYLSFDVTIPAGGSIIVEATQPRNASVDYVGKDRGRDGYDMATLLGSSLDFTGQAASISSFDEIEIIAQNFGFDLAGGITDVTLDLAQPHYWMEVRKIHEE